MTDAKQRLRSKSRPVWLGGHHAVALEDAEAEIDRLHLENARLRSRRICGTCEGSGAAVYSFGEPSATPWEVADAVPSWVEWQTAQSYPYAAVISSPWTWWEDGGARCQFCRHCGGTGWVEAVTR